MMTKEGYKKIRYYSLKYDEFTNNAYF